MPILIVPPPDSLLVLSPPLSPLSSSSSPQAATVTARHRAMTAASSRRVQRRLLLSLIRLLPLSLRLTADFSRHSRLQRFLGRRRSARRRPSTGSPTPGRRSHPLPRLFP